MPLHQSEGRIIAKRGRGVAGVSAGLPPRRLLLLGGGHAQLAVLQALARERIDGWRITLLTPQRRLIYSGMLPGWMAGHYRLRQCAIDLAPLAEAAGAELRLGRAVGLDAERRRVRLEDGGELGYARMSLDIGSGIALGALAGAALPVRPLAAFVSGWRRIVARSAARPGLRLAVIGGGAGGAELAFAARQRLSCEVLLVSGEAGLLPGQSAAVQARARHWLERRGIRLLGGPVVRRAGVLRLPDGSALAADALIAATGAEPAPWLAASGLALAGSGGQVLVDARQQSVSHPDVFAAGDVCQRTDGALQPSGVHAVRAGPVLAANLLASLHGRPLRAWRPRAHSLYLLATGPRHALMSYGPLSASGAWVWRWKDHIDRAFIARHAAAAIRAA